jgi:hypothetical protein
MIRLRGSLLALVLCLGPAAAGAAGGFDGTRPLSCYADDAASCDDATDTCQQGDAEAVSLPDSLRVDFATKQVSRVSPVDGTTLASPIGTQTRLDGYLVLQGAEGGAGWTLLVAEDGKMTVSVVRTGGAVVVFGRCYAEQAD